MSERRSRPSYGTQLYWAVWKNLLLKRRNIRSTFKELAFPIYTFVLVSLLKVRISQHKCSLLLLLCISSSLTLPTTQAAIDLDVSNVPSEYTVRITATNHLPLHPVHPQHSLDMALLARTHTISPPLLLPLVPRAHFRRVASPRQAEPIPPLDRTHAGKLCMGMFDRRGQTSGTSGGVVDSQSSQMPAPPCLLLITPDTDETVAQIATRVATDLRTAPVLGVMTFGNVTAAKRYHLDHPGRVMASINVGLSGGCRTGSTSKYVKFKSDRMSILRDQMLNSELYTVTNEPFSTQPFNPLGRKSLQVRGGLRHTSQCDEHDGSSHRVQRQGRDGGWALLNTGKSSFWV
jgi:hypothetical protein